MRAFSKPAIVGRYIAAGQTYFYPANEGDLFRDKLAVAEIIDGFDPAPARYVLVISLNEEVVQVLPFEYAVNERGMIVTNADATTYESIRVESILRRFDVAMVAGLNGAVLDGLETSGHDVAALLKHRIVWARPCAYERLEAMNLIDTTLLRWVEFGPVLGLECSQRSGVHIDCQEWTVEEKGGEIVISGRLARAAPFDQIHTGVHACIERQPCPCGSGDARLIV